MVTAHDTNVSTIISVDALGVSTDASKISSISRGMALKIVIKANEIWIHQAVNVKAIYAIIK